eukprot:maker-scaffold171_size289870-snap-gene-1.44 protein:Tk00427 transcript:maker-scaffold171_size289870-snap-gene-1.44-mRNA-1 annotation:"hypothetical protein LOTGIDRAFT_238595"
MNEIRRILVCSQGVPGLFETLQRVLPNIRVERVSDLDPDTTKGFQKEIVVADNDLIGQLIYRPSIEFAFVQGTWAGIDPILHQIRPDQGLPQLQVARFTNRQFSQLMSEYALAQVIQTERGLGRIREDHIQGIQSWRQAEFVHPRLIRELTIGILGVGSIGREVARTFQFFGAKILGFIRTLPIRERSPFVDHYFDQTNLNEMLPQCDYICNILPRTAQTTGLLSEELLEKCKGRKPVFINIGRDNVIEEEVLIKALDENWLSGAILDVFAQEPLPQNHPFWQHPKIAITPHIAGPSRAMDIAECVQRNLELYYQGLPIENLVDWQAQY